MVITLLIKMSSSSSFFFFIIYSLTKANGDEFDLIFQKHVTLRYYSRNMTRYALLIALNADNMKLARTLPLKSSFHNKRVLKGFYFENICMFFEDSRYKCFKL